MSDSAGLVENLSVDYRVYIHITVTEAGIISLETNQKKCSLTKVLQPDILTLFLIPLMLPDLFISSFFLFLF